jgi:hypothetical protein
MHDVAGPEDPRLVRDAVEPVVRAVVGERQRDAGQPWTCSLRVALIEPAIAAGHSSDRRFSRSSRACSVLPFRAQLVEHCLRGNRRPAEPVDDRPLPVRTLERDRRRASTDSPSSPSTKCRRSRTNTTTSSSSSAIITVEMLSARTLSVAPRDSPRRSSHSRHTPAPAAPAGPRRRPTRRPQFQVERRPPLAISTSGRTRGRTRRGSAVRPHRGVRASTGRHPRGQPLPSGGSTLHRLTVGPLGMGTTRRASARVLPGSVAAPPRAHAPARSVTRVA